jgi:cytochrome c oxidase cbb3-type subunit 3/ubiquinol-cytochrome c reductase cytochrome c subunit
MTLLGGRLQVFVACLAALLATIASGNLECSPLGESPDIARGRELYGRMCAVCHGANGEGYKADQAPALANPTFLASVSDAFLVRAITNGRVGSTMSAWGLEHGGPLPPSEVTSVVRFLRTWEKGPAPTLDESPRAGDASRGASVFQQQCQTCHGVLGAGGKFVSIGNADLLASASDGFLRYAIREGRPGTVMAPFRTTLGEQRIEDVLAFLRSMKPPPGAKPVPSLAAPARPPPLPLGPVPLNPRGPEPRDFDTPGGFTKADIVKRELDRGARMGILDARAPPDYTSEHIAGAVSVPFYDPEPYIASLPKDAWLVAYCGCPHAESGQLAAKLRAKGFTKVTVIDEGLRYWSSRKYGTKKGTLP